MKNFKRYMLISIMLSGSAFAQDTVFFKNQGVTVVKVIEVSNDHIKYRYASDSTNFVYDTDKNRLLYIKYGNGVVDSIKPASVAVIDNSTKNEIRIEDGKLRYHGKVINDRKLKSLINNCPDSEAKFMMQEDYRLMKAHGRAQKVYSPIIMGLSGAAIPASLLVLVFNVNDPHYTTEARLQTLGAGFLTAAVGIVTGAVMSTLNHKKRVRKRNAIALLYNKVN